jgi:UPF0042 nucleotide-binding protein
MRSSSETVPAGRGGLQVVVVTGLSGSGRGAAIRLLEDLGFYCIDNLPVVLIPKFLELCGNSEEELSRVAFGIDLRERSFLRDYPRVFAELRAAGHRIEILYLEAADDVLVRRFSETRRPHPLAGDRGVPEGIRAEQEKLAGLREIADRVIDTSALSVHELREELYRILFPSCPPGTMTLFLVSFGYKHGIPSDTDLALDVRFLPNPFFVEELRHKSGMESEVMEFVLKREETRAFLQHLLALLDFTLPRYAREGKSYLTVAVGCTGGRHRSVVVVEELKRHLTQRHYPVYVRHRDIQR